MTPAAAAEPDMALPPPLQYRSLRRSLYATVFVTMDVRTEGRMGSADPLPRKMDEKLKSENTQKRAVFYVYVIF